MGKVRSAIAGAILFGLTAAIASPAAVANDHPDISGIWTWYVEAGSNPFAPGAPENLPFTPEGKRRRDEYNKLLGPEKANPGAYCVIYGMPSMMEMAGGYPIEFIQQPKQLTIIFEVEGETRRVYFGDRVQPDADRIPSRDGYSVGHWEGDTLVVQTDNLTDGVDQLAHPHSDQAKIVERFNLGKDAKGEKVLQYEMTLTDPVYYTAPVILKKKWAAMPDGHIIPYTCTEDSWLKLLDLRRKQLNAGKPVTATIKDAYDEVYKQ